MANSVYILTVYDMTVLCAFILDISNVFYVKFEYYRMLVCCFYEHRQYCTSWHTSLGLCICLGLFVTDHFSGPDRAVSPVCVCVCLDITLELNDL